MSYFIHYTVFDPQGPETLRGVKVRRLVAGPYTMDEALAKRRDLDGDEGSAVNVHIEER